MCLMFINIVLSLKIHKKKIDVYIPTLNVLIYPLSEVARGTKIKNLDGAALRVAQQNILWLQVTVDNLDLRRGEEQQRRRDLLRELAR